VGMIIEKPKKRRNEKLLDCHRHLSYGLVCTVERSDDVIAIICLCKLEYVHVCV